MLNVNYGCGSLGTSEQKIKTVISFLPIYKIPLIVVNKNKVYETALLNQLKTIRHKILIQMRQSQNSKKYNCMDFEEARETTKNYKHNC